MATSLTKALEKYNAEYTCTSKGKYQISNQYCKIDFLKERYEDGFVVILETIQGSYNLQVLKKRLVDYPDKPAFGGDPNDIENVAALVMWECADILDGNFERLKKVEASKNIYYEVDKKRAKEWIVFLSQKLAEVTDIAITYNPVHYPPYEHHHLQVANQYGTVFRIGYGHFNRDESGYVVDIIECEKIVESKKIYDSRDMDDILVDFLRKKR